MKLIKDYWMDIVAWGILIPYMTYIWMYYSWQAFIINIIFGVIGLASVQWFGHVMPIVGYFIRKWEREKQDGDARRQ